MYEEALVQLIYNYQAYPIPTNTSYATIVSIDRVCPVLTICIGGLICFPSSHIIKYRYLFNRTSKSLREKKERSNFTRKLLRAKIGILLGG
jgi:hypothetical protein